MVTPEDVPSTAWCGTLPSRRYVHALHTIRFSLVAISTHARSKFLLEFFGTWRTTLFACICGIMILLNILDALLAIPTPMFYIDAGWTSFLP